MDANQASHTRFTVSKRLGGPERLNPPEFDIELSTLHIAQTVGLLDSVDKCSGYLYYASGRRPYLQKQHTTVQSIAATLQMIEEWNELNPVLRQISQETAELIIADHNKKEMTSSDLRKFHYNNMIEDSTDIV